MTVTVATVLSVLGLPACAGLDDDSSAEAESAASGAPALSDASFAHDLTKQMVAATHSLSADVFEAKWRASLTDGPLMFLRAYPAAFHQDLAAAPVPGREGLCVGDAHPDNFGYLRVDDGHGRRSIYAFNDLDDSGRCRIAVDALRYFVAFRLAFDDDSKLEDSIDDYVDEAFGGDASNPVDAAWKKAKDQGPDWSNIHDETLTKYVSGDAFRSLGPDELLAVSAQQRSDVITALAQSPSGAGVDVLDVAQRPRVAGGSGGLTRYWAYIASADGGRTILELKETARPGVELGAWTTQLVASTRLSTLKREFWNVRSDSDYFEVSIDGARFLVRDRTLKASADTNGQLRKAQAVYLGALHHGGWSPTKKSAARDWLKKSSKVVAKRWKKFYDDERHAIR